MVYRVYLLRRKGLARRTVSQSILDEPNCALRISHFYHQFVKSLVMQINYDSILRVMHVPEDSLAVLIEGSGSNHSGHTGSGHPHAVQPSACDLRVGSDARDVDERYFEAALESPKLVSPSYVQRQFAFSYRS